MNKLFSAIASGVLLLTPFISAMALPNNEEVPVVFADASRFLNSQPYIITGDSIYINSPIQDAEQYTGLLLALDTCSNRHLQMFISSPGGSVVSMYAISDAMKNSKCTIDVRVRGMAASAAAIIAISGTSLSLSDGSLIMFHNIELNDQDSLNLVIGRATSFANSLENFLNNNASDLLTKTEIHDIMNGKEIWLNKKQVDERLLPVNVKNTLVEKIKDLRVKVQEYLNK